MYIPTLQTKLRFILGSKDLETWSIKNYLNILKFLNDNTLILDDASYEYYQIHYPGVKCIYHLNKIQDYKYNFKLQNY